MEVEGMHQWKWWTRLNESGGHAPMETVEMHLCKWWTRVNGRGRHANQIKIKSNVA